MGLKEQLIGEYTGTFIPSMKAQIIRNRTRIYESERGHLSYVITEHVTDEHRRVSGRETYVGLVTQDLLGAAKDAETVRLHLSPLDKPYRTSHEFRCEFHYDERFDAFVLMFIWKEGTEEQHFLLKKISSNGTGRRRRR